MDIDKLKHAVEWFFNVMECGNIRNDKEQEVYEIAIDALNKQIREYEQNKR